MGNADKIKATKTGYETVCHRDGTVTVWSVYRQSWMRVRAADVSDETLATLPERDRVRIALAAGEATP